MQEIKNIAVYNRFTDKLSGDPITENYVRQVREACYSYVKTISPSQPKMVYTSEALKSFLQLDQLNEDDFLQLMSGQASFPDFKSYAMCYGGHQFGHWARQLGDGRAINIGEIKIKDKHWTLQLKGSGPTPYSRRADGYAVLRSSIREFLCSEAMQHLGIATTRALSLSLSGALITRDIMYDGNPKQEQGAIVCRVAPSFLRFGSYEIHSARKDIDSLRSLVDYTIRYHFPQLGSPSKEVYLSFFKTVMLQTKEMIINWQRVGFVHGVMNTDNMSILGLTIDYGPYGWLEDYNPDWTPNTTDAQNKRYRFGNQATIGLWNLSQLANAIYPLIEEAAPLENILLEYRDQYHIEYIKMMLSKIGIVSYQNEDENLIISLEALLQSSELDMTLFFRNLNQFHDTKPLNYLPTIEKASYLSSSNFQNQKQKWLSWLDLYAARLNKEETPPEIRIKRMNLINPKYVLRNYMAQLAIDDANKGNYKLIDELYTLLLQPYEEQKNMEKWFVKRPEWAREKIGCSMLSCSS